MWIINRAPSVCFVAAGMNKMEVKNQQIQTEIVKTVEQHVQAGSTAKQQGVCCENKYEEETIDIATLLSFYSDLFIYCVTILIPVLWFKSVCFFTLPSSSFRLPSWC